MRLVSFVPGISEGAFSGAFFVKIGIVLIKDPFDDIAVNIIKAPGVRFFLADLLIFEIAILFEPGVLAEFGGIVAKEISISGTSATCVFPFSFSGQAIKLAGLGAEPLAVFISAMLSHADGGKAFFAHAKAHFDIGFGRMRDCIGQFITGFVRWFSGTHALL